MFGRATTIGVCIAVVAALAGCSGTRNALNSQSYAYEGYGFKGRLQRDKADRAQFAVTVRGADRGVIGALEAARIEANRYCIAQYGNTDISWNGIGPDSDVSDVALTDGGTLELSGRCSSW